MCKIFVIFVTLNFKIKYTNQIIFYDMKYMNMSVLIVMKLHGYWIIWIYLLRIERGYISWHINVMNFISPINVIYRM